MKIVTITPYDDDKPTLKTLLNETERRLRGKGTTLIREKAGRWVHATYHGWITWDIAKGGIIVAKIHSRKPQAEWQLLQAFIGYLNRHLGDYIDTIMIKNR